MLVQSSTFCQLPPDVLQVIALEAAVVDPIGLLEDFVTLLQTCQYVYSLLSSTHNHQLYGLIFRRKFDTDAVRRRFGGRAMCSRNLSAQLRDYCAALKRIRSGDIFAPTETLEKTLWSAFFLLMANDGKNYAQLQWAGLKGFVDRFVRERLWDEHDKHRGWAVDSPINSLALYLMWYTTDYETLQAETPETRRQVMEIIRPYVVAPFKYSPFHAPDVYFNLPLHAGFLNDPPFIVRTPHGSYPRYPKDEELVEHVHHGIGLKLRPPLIAIYAGLLYFARSEAVTYQIPTHFPADRDTAHTYGLYDVGPTQDDFARFNAHKGACVVPKGSWSLPDGMAAPSLSWDNDWNRMRHCNDPCSSLSPRRTVYTYGSLSGDWLGRMLMPDPTQYLDTVRAADYKPGYPMMTTLPISFHLREHDCVNPHTPVPCGVPTQQGRHPDDGIANAWLPTGASFYEHNNILEVRTARSDGRAYRYETFQEGKIISHDETSCADCRAKDSLERADRTGYSRLTELPTAREFPLLDYGMEDAEVTSTRQVIETALGPDDSLEDVLSLVESEARVLYGFDDARVEDDMPCDGVRDVILTGETLPKHGEAWHRFRFYGRVRHWDGLIALVRVPLQNPDLGITIFRGYVVANQNFIGSWRSWSRPPSLPLEGPFIVSRAPHAE